MEQAPRQATKEPLVTAQQIKHILGKLCVAEMPARASIEPCIILKLFRSQDPWHVHLARAIREELATQSLTAGCLGVDWVAQPLAYLTSGPTSGPTSSSHPSKNGNIRPNIGPNIGSMQFWKCGGGHSVFVFSLDIPTYLPEGPARSFMCRLY